MDILVKNSNFSLSLSLTILRLTGFWPPETLRKHKMILYNCYGFIFFVSFMVVFLISELADLVLIWGNLPLMTGTSFILFTNLAHATKFINIVVRRDSVLKIITDSDDILKGETSVEGRKIIDSCNRETRWQQIFYFLLTFFTCMGWANSAEKNELPLRGWYPYNTNKPIAYEITYFYQVIWMFGAPFLNVSKDTVVTTLIAQCRCRLRLVSLSLRNLCNNEHFAGERSPSKTSLMVSEKTLIFTPAQETILYKRLRTCAIKHQKVLETTLLLQNTFSEPIFAQFNVSLVIICVTAFQLVSQTGNYLRLISMSTYLMNMMYQVFLYCYQGDQLSAESEELAKAAYEVPWYACNVPLRSSLLIIMVRCRRVVRLTAAGLSTLSLNTFTAVIKTSYSLFTLLQQVTE